VLEAWQNLAATAPDGFSSIFAATASRNGGESLLLANGELQVGDDWRSLAEGLVRDEPIDTPEDLLWAILRTHWLDDLPPKLRPDRDTDFLVAEVSAGEAATIAASLVPMPFFNQWKLNSRSTFDVLAADELAPIFDYLRLPGPSDDLTRAVGYLNPWLLGGRSNEIDPESAVVPVREGAVMWVHAGAQWNDPALEGDALAWVEGLWEVVTDAVQSDAAFYGIPELELGGQYTWGSDLRYVPAYWSSPTHDFVPFLLDVKARYDPDDVFWHVQSIPLTLEGLLDDALR
jgi:FAD/FMN-containing dehydrogenase